MAILSVFLGYSYRKDCDTGLFSRNLVGGVGDIAAARREGVGT